jgi:hypothetical protein
MTASMSFDLTISRGHLTGDSAADVRQIGALLLPPWAAGAPAITECVRCSGGGRAKSRRYGRQPES